MKTRIYGDKTNIKYEKTKEFWQGRADGNMSLKTVLLGADKPNGAQEERNNKEIQILNSFINKDNLKILDIGCGIGRWANNLKDRIEYYDGIDFSDKFIDYNKKQFKNDEKFNFQKMSLLEIDESKLKCDYNLILTCGVLMYINDNDLYKYFNSVKSIIKKINPTPPLYLQETISLLDMRLTLNNFQSSDLKTNYSAIYRTKKEYEEYLKDFEIIKTDTFLKENTGARAETNARYWILRLK